VNPVRGPTEKDSNGVNQTPERYVTHCRPIAFLFWAAQGFAHYKTINHRWFQRTGEVPSEISWLSQYKDSSLNPLPIQGAV